MLKQFLLVFTIFIFSTSIIGQEGFSFTETSLYSETVESENYLTSNLNQNTDFQKYWSFGGNLGLSFWNGETNILLGPKAYYNVSPKFLTGFGLTYIYSDYNSGIYKFKSNSFGGSVMAAVRPIHFLQISAEYEGLQTNQSGYYTEDYWNNALFLGISFVSGPVSFGLRYDVLFDEYRSVYSSALTPVIGFYF